MAQATAYPHIETDANGRAVIAGTGTPVIMVAIDRLAYHWDADEIRRQRPHLTLGQVHMALAYYHDHEEQLNAEIAERLRLEDELLNGLGQSRVRAKLQAARRVG
jgi:uncharacterized protein (DUF433 family)